LFLNQHIQSNSSTSKQRKHEYFHYETVSCLGMPLLFPVYYFRIYIVGVPCHAHVSVSVSHAWCFLASW